jgi:hemoglobin
MNAVFPKPHTIRIFAADMKHDILTEDDISRWLHSFYDKLLEDPVTAPKFAHTNLPEHMPRIVQFWAFVLLEKEGYKTNVFEKHVPLHLEQIHFERWIHHFINTTDDMFEGPNAEIAKQRAKLLATTFLHKITGEFHTF